MTRRYTLLLLTSLVAAGTLLRSDASHAETWPARTIKWIVPFQAGSAPDASSRIIADAMSALLKQPIVIENKPGAAGNLGTQIAARSPVDGYTWLYASSVTAANMKLYKAPGFDAFKDFTHISTIGSSDSLLVTHKTSGITSLADLLAAARAKPGSLNYGSSGAGTPSHLGMALLLKVADLNLVHVPYRGAPAILNALMTKEIQVGLPILSVALPQVQSGDFIALAVASRQRNPALPQVPTFEEAGLQGVLMESFGGLSVPAGTPADIVTRIHGTLDQVLADPAIRARLDTIGMARVFSTKPGVFTAMLQDELAVTVRMMEAAGLTTGQ